LQALRVDDMLSADGALMLLGASRSDRRLRDATAVPKPLSAAGRSGSLETAV
jgi:hypothetical protein